MAAVLSLPDTVPVSARRHATTETAWVRWLLTGLALAFLALFLAVPLVAVFTQGLANGWNVYLAAITEPYALDAIRLTLLVAAISLPLNVLFGLAAAWAIAKFHFRGKQLLGPVHTNAAHRR